MRYRCRFDKLLVFRTELEVKLNACYDRLCRAQDPPLKDGVETLNALAHESVALAMGQRLARYIYDEPRVWSEHS